MCFFKVDRISKREIDQAKDLIFSVWTSVEEAEKQVLEHELDQSMKVIWLNAIRIIKKYS